MLNHIKTYKKKGHELLVEDILCDRHFENRKKETPLAYESSKDIEIKVIKLSHGSQFNCQDCMSH